MPTHPVASDTVLRSLSTSRGTPVLKDLLDRAKKCKPDSDYDSRMWARQQHYRGKTRGFIEAALKARYPQTYKTLPIIPQPIVRMIADNDTTSYRAQPERWLVLDGAPVDETSDADTQQRAQQFAEMLRHARIDRKLLAVTRKSTIAKTMFLRFGWRSASSIDDVGVVTMQQYWPHQVHVIHHFSAPESLASAVAIIARIEGPSASDIDEDPRVSPSWHIRWASSSPRKHEWYEVWTRSAAFDRETQRVEYGLWRAELLSSGGDSLPLFGNGIYPLMRAPWVAVYDGEPEGCVFVDEDDDLLDIVDASNVAMSDHYYTLSMSGHPVLAIMSNRDLQNKSVILDQGHALLLETGDSVTQIRSDVSTAALDTHKMLMQNLANARQQPRDSYTTEKNAGVQTGIARIIERLPATEKRQERQTILQDTEENQILPLMAEISDYWGGTTIAHMPRNDDRPGAVRDDVAYRVDFAQEELAFEPPREKQDRLVGLVDAGLMSPARAAVELGVYDTEDDAAEAGLARRPLVAAGSAIPPIDPVPISGALERVLRRVPPLTATGEPRDEPAGGDQ